jgi:hypothetical protein
LAGVAGACKVVNPLKYPNGDHTAILWWAYKKIHL